MTKIYGQSVVLERRVTMANLHIITHLTNTNPFLLAYTSCPFSLLMGALFLNWHRPLPCTLNSCIYLALYLLLFSWLVLSQRRKSDMPYPQQVLHHPRLMLCGQRASPWVCPFSVRLLFPLFLELPGARPQSWSRWGWRQNWKNLGSISHRK